VASDKNGIAKYLGRPGNLGPQVPGDPRPYMAVYAGDPRMGAIQIGGVLRLHYGVAYGSAKSDRIREKVGIICG